MSDPEKSAEKHMTFMEHLEELRSCLLRSLAAVAVALVVAIPAAPTIMALLKEPLRRSGRNPEDLIGAMETGGGMSAAMVIIFWTAVLLAAPFITFFVGSFIFPGLTQREKKAVVRSSGFTIALFFGGVWLCYRHTLHYMFQFFDMVNIWLGIKQDTIILSSYLSTTLKLMIAFGLVFQLPVVLFFLGLLGIVTTASLLKYWRQWLVGTMILAAVVTPTDLASMLFMWVPLYALYWITFWLIWVVEKNRKTDGQNSALAVRGEGE